MASHNVSLPDDLSERVKRRQQRDGMWKLSWWVQRQLEVELSAWERELAERHSPVIRGSQGAYSDDSTAHGETS